MYTNSNVWVAIILAGIAGCVMTAFFANSIKGVPVMAIAGNWKKHLWSIIFAIPIPFLLGLNQFGVLIAFLWLVLAPTIASKIYFGPKDLPAMVLNAFHCGYAIAALLVYVFVTRYFVMLI
ncbi:MAG: hypothetical protein COC00_005470 [Rhizobiales bacterium]|nr:hypothetical protein [Hyphomicrobiales bacterium]